MKKGKFITIYGVNNIGKTTHANLLVERLKKNGFKAIHIKYPVYDVDPSGSFINGVLRNPDGQKISEEELQLWYVINRYQFQPKLIEYLDDGYIVIAEDYAGTGIAWGITKGLEESWIECVNKKVIHEDLAILIEGQRDISAIESGHVHEENHELIEKSIQVHFHLAEKFNWKKIRLQEKMEETASLIWNEVDSFLKQ